MQKLIRRAKQGDKQAKELIVESFMPLIYKASSNIYVAGYETEDLVQEGRKSILKAIELYKLEGTGSFPAYCKMAVENNFKYLIRGRVRDNYQKSLNDLQEDGAEIGDFIPSDYDLEQDIINKEFSERLREVIKRLTPEERERIYYFFLKDHGGITEYAALKKIPYREAYKEKMALINKLRQYII